MPDNGFELNARQALVWMMAPSCQTGHDAMRSGLARQVMAQFIDVLEQRNSPLLAVASAAEEGGHRARAIARLTEALLLLVDTPYETVMELVPSVRPILADRELLAEFVEKLYDYWRGLERYLIFESRAASSRDRALEGHTTFILAHEQLKLAVLDAYRRIEANVRGHWPRVYRQVAAGANMSVLVERIPWDCPGGPYERLREVRMVRLALLEPPVVLYPRENVRKGRFTAARENPLAGVEIEPEDWFCMPVNVGPLVMFVMFHKEYLALGASLVNLFELTGHAEARRRPDGILVIGVPPEALGEEQTVFFEDDENQVVLGAIGRSAEVDYFGYFKKMTLTLHNLIMMRRGRLPFHGAMCRIELKSGEAATVVIVGDSAAGKSETLEAFRTLADEHLRSYTIIADDMGSLELTEEGVVRGYGTEIGAFVRLDDLQMGYAFGQLDRSVFMNPHRTNARVVIPVTSFEEVMAGHRVDLFLYANNYEQVDEGRPCLEMFEGPAEAMRVFAEGARGAKGTSDEQGLVRTYFGNPFGAAQRREVHDPMARRFLEAMFAGGVRVGQVRTRLAMPGFEQRGPEEAARALFGYVAGGGNDRV